MTKFTSITAWGRSTCAAALLGRDVVSEESGRVVIGGNPRVDLTQKSGASRMTKTKHPMKVIFDRLYVPLDTVNHLFGCAVKWKAREKTLVFPAPKQKHATLPIRG